MTAVCIPSNCSANLFLNGLVIASNSLKERPQQRTRATGGGKNKQKYQPVVAARKSARGGADHKEPKYGV
jgi:hypothetical protein